MALIAGDQPPPDPPAGGWRDDPVPYPDACSVCDGWGARERWDRITDPNARQGHRLLPRGLMTCRNCRGTGRAPTPS